MTETAPLPQTLNLHVPFRIEKRGGRKAIIPPQDDMTTTPSAPEDNQTIIKALGRAFRWKRMLDSGEFQTLKELAAHENISPSYLTRVMRLTLLAPDIIEDILKNHTYGLALSDLLNPFPVDWAKQRHYFAM
ncbi:hypothetical protein Q4560_04020 [Celeribacter halophilus]|uniref:hypothetical protein n=1 Tax=Celeribacter halophilus TaxID=576117 RepID=UPI0026E308A5|nr:hypothetical protein [Celeribacter halophilus]MDO6722425.1 hypothetical protein [Celeribacter halophilus]